MDRKGQVWSFALLHLQTALTHTRHPPAARSHALICPLDCSPKFVLYQFRHTAHLHSYCKHKNTDAFIQLLCDLLMKYHSRWAFIDLTAGPFAWGPAVGGEGVRTELSLPNVGKTIGAVEGSISSSFSQMLLHFSKIIHAISPLLLCTLVNYDI